ncbi:hypothetical protein CQA57_02360 [Helicobacter anseris]|uniref:Glycosyltransferase 2-like domain-containing protein n=1 Tax=Helicobacter anseris TaxID=375926 RepID=A0A3D8JA87_9HELI|nr:glycosyltransferase family 2 protein [Helicobacter anseris]RDU74342.1 hypothetical protein CQA57_02360 [Helicobacter anseris]
MFKECLDFVINQTYKNLQFVLVDDGSTDNSFAIAKEYFDKDKRIALIKKENKGLSHTRNVGLDYLAQSLVGGGGLEVFEHQSPLIVDYIHFLDSDDWLELSCIEECVNSALASQADIIWHNFFIFSEENGKIEGICQGLFENFCNEKSYTPLEVFSKLGGKSFSWAWCGMYRFYGSAKNLRFVEGVESEDVPFGMMLFSLARQVFILDKGLAFYRIRPNSISQHTLHQSGFVPKWPAHMTDIVKAFDCNPCDVRYYSFAYSACVMCIEIDKFVKSIPLELELRNKLFEMIGHRAFFAFGSITFAKDPRNCRKMLEALQEYKKYASFGSKVAYHFPRIYKILKAIKNKFLR